MIRTLRARKDSREAYFAGAFENWWSGRNRGTRWAQAARDLRNDASHSFYEKGPVGGYQSGQSFVHGTTTAVYVGGGVVALGAVAAALIRRRPRQAEVVALDAEPVLEA